ncbi:1,2-epoxyphenylacetyl-CoA isomerase [Paraburkholderia hiiakae]|uniref:1,2-epoxyphenylacetyl-CoA isomerase n=1 Tax=Paraburkholderia hiiakae TaxID=1081782 RepID=A0ABM8PB66_9BURK|nr:enoyl-CoA hydratase/isomerase family protein [Paraburkholderia hiiakae]CAD6561577.1 1,2-epoxyphenylacetyl-CoA isomerase [Paraburkholderia hiiakae]
MIKTTIEDGIATVVLARPERKNALNAAMFAELGDIVDALRRDTSVKALLLTGEGDDFCAGADVSSMQTATDAADVHARMLENQRPCHAFASFERPVIAAVDGVAYGAGFSLALMADFVLASERARFSLAFARIGLVPDLGMVHMLPRMIGIQRARELIYSARELPAAEAQALGLVLDVCPPAELRARALELARALASQSAVGFALTKRLLAHSFERSLTSLLDAEAGAQAVAFTSAYVMESAARFIRKEPARFSWPPFAAK